MKKTLLTLLAAIFAMVATAQDQAPAFPGAEGHGRYVTGGRGGTVVHVTNLNDSGTGSLRSAVSSSNRIVVFDVGGIIELKSDLTIKGNVTILGQTAPAPGITLRYYTVRPNGNNIIMRFIRIRRGEEKNVNDGADATWARNFTGIILDHCSFSWSIDEVASYYDNRNFTMQWCSVGESLVNPGHSKGPHGYGGIWGGKEASFHHNMIIHVNNRAPRLNGARYGWQGYDKTKYKNTIEAEIVDLRNCVMYNWGDGNGAYAGQGGYHNIVNNYYKAGPATKNKTRVFQCVIVDDGNATIKDTIKLTQPVITGSITTHSAQVAFEKVLENVGASLHRDVVDNRHMEEARNGTTTYIGSSTSYEKDGKTYPFTPLPGLIDKVADQGTYNLETVTRPAGFDTDGDGIPDEWEIANGLNPNDKSDGNAKTIDTEKGFYTNLEVYANSLVEDIMKAGMADGVSNYTEYWPAYNTTTGISQVRTSAITATEYYDLSGRKLSEPQRGINIRVERMANGQAVTSKVIK